MTKFGAIQKIDNLSEDEKTGTDMIFYKENWFRIIQVSSSEESIKNYIEATRLSIANIQFVLLHEKDELTNKEGQGRYQIVEEVME